jgi:hypothetical protein
MVTVISYQQELGAISYQPGRDQIGVRVAAKRFEAAQPTAQDRQSAPPLGFSCGRLSEAQSLRATESFPSTERYGLVSQMRRAAISTQYRGRCGTQSQGGDCLLRSRCTWLVH